MSDAPKITEMDQGHRERVCRLLWEIGSNPGGARPDQFLAAYQAVLMKDLLWVNSELLGYKQNEVHR